MKKYIGKWLKYGNYYYFITKMEHDDIAELYNIVGIYCSLEPKYICKIINDKNPWIITDLSLKNFTQIKNLDLVKSLNYKAIKRIFK